MLRSHPYTLTDVKVFGEQLVVTEDLDPVYVAVHKARLPEPQLKRLLLAYWMFYSLGGAARLSEAEGREFWHEAKLAAANTTPIHGQPSERFPRGAERRHFRGAKCVDAVCAFAALGRPEAAVEQLLRPASGRNTLQATTIMEWVEEWPMFGPWIAFKAADMIERLFGIPVEFDVNLTLFYAEPRGALNLLPGDPQENTQKLIAHFAHMSAPPRHERGCNVQEVETILCKWKSSTTKHYWIGKDIHEIRHGLYGWGSTAQRLLDVAPKELVKEGQFF